MHTKEIYRTPLAAQPDRGRKFFLGPQPSLGEDFWNQTQVYAAKRPYQKALLILK
jgi:hypothetical protein